MSQKKDARLIWVKLFTCRIILQLSCCLFLCDFLFQNNVFQNILSEIPSNKVANSLDPDQDVTIHQRLFIGRKQKLSLVGKKLNNL